MSDLEIYIYTLDQEKVHHCGRNERIFMHNHVSGMGLIGDKYSLLVS